MAPLEDQFDSVDWGVGQGSAPQSTTPGQRASTPWPAPVRRRRALGVVFAFLGLLLATWAAMNLAKSAGAGHPFMPPWVVVVLAGAGLVAAAGYLAWAGGTPVRREAQRWEPTVLDAAAGLTRGQVRVSDPQQLLETHHTPQLAAGSVAPGSPRSADTRPTVESGPTPLMGTSTLDQDTNAPAGVAGAVGGFLLAAAVVCVVLATILPTGICLGVAIALGGCGFISVHLAATWLGKI